MSTPSVQAYLLIVSAFALRKLPVWTVSHVLILLRGDGAPGLCPVADQMCPCQPAQRLHVMQELGPCHESPSHCLCSIY